MSIEVAKIEMADLHKKILHAKYNLATSQKLSLCK